MNTNTFRLVFSQRRGMLVAVEETAAGNGKAASGETTRLGGPHGHTPVTRFALRQAAFAAMLLLGAVPATSYAQIVAAPGSGASVIQTPNGLPQVNIARPSGAGVSVSTYSQFDVQHPGAILNNSPVITSTQLAGQINGNPNLSPGQSARIIVNQVNSSAASQINGPLEVAGARAAVVIANGSGISVNGGSFINTSRATLTTGTPNYGPDGSLTGFDVRGGQITVLGDGLNASNVDQVDLIARAVAINAKLYANTLNVIAGANHVDHDSLATTPIAGDGAAPAVSIDVSQLGGMYANRIILASNEYGVGVSNAGVIAAQAGDLTLQSNGRLVLTGSTSASGNLSVDARDGITNGGTTYAQQLVTVNTAGDLVNSGTLAAQQDLTANAANVASTGILAAGLNADGTLAQAGELNLTAAGVLSAHGSNAAGGNATLSGAALDLGGSTTQAGGNLTLAANAGDLNLASATVSANGTLSATASGTLTSDNGSLTSGGAQTIRAGALSNRNGQIVSGSTLSANVAGAIANQGGVMQAAGRADIQGASLDNTAARIVSLNSDGLIVTTAGLLDNGLGGVIGGNGNVTAQTGQLANAGSITAAQSLIASAVQTLFNGGTLAANGNVTLSAGSVLTNASNIASGHLVTLTAATFDNSYGNMGADQLALHAANLVNHAGMITQTGTGAMTVDVSGTLDNSASGTLQTNSTDLTLAPATLINDAGTITHAGTGTLTLAPGNGAGAISNVAGSIISAGQIIANAGSLNNSGGVFAALGGIRASFTGNVNNVQGLMRSLSSLSLHSGGALTNVNGSIQSGTGSVNDASTLDIQAASVDNSGGLASNLGTGAATVQGGTSIVNSQGTVTGNGDVTLGASSLLNTQGGQFSGANVTVRGDTLDNSDGTIGTVAYGDVDIMTTGAVTNSNGQIGATHDVSVNASTLYGGGAYSAANNVTLNLQGDFSVLPGYQFNTGNRLAFSLPGTFSNAASLLSINDFTIDAGNIVNSGTIAAGGLLATHSNTLTNTGAMVGGSVSLAATSTLSNLGPTALIGATDSNGLLELLAPDIENRDDTTATDTQAQTAIFGLGRVVLAGGKDANGNYTNAALIRNQSALIESGSDMALYAGQVTNTRRVMTTGWTSDVDPALLEQLGISLSGQTGQIGVSDPTSIGGAYIDPPHGGQWNSTYQYTTYTGVALANIVTSISPQAQIVSGGNLSAASVGLFQNYWSAVAAVGNIAMPFTLDQNSWQGQTAPQVLVTYSGQYHYNNYDNTEHDWQLPFGDAPFVGSQPGGYTQKAPADIRPYGLPDYESSFVPGGTLSGTGVSIDNTAGNAGIPSLGLLPGQSLGGVNPGGVNGKPGVNVDPVIAAATAVNVLGNLTIPQGGLFKPSSAPGATYVIETNPAFTSSRSFLSSDYYLQQLGLNPQTTEKRLGDGFYEQQLVRDEITALTGKAVLGPYTDIEAMYEALLGAGAGLAQSLNLPLGMSLSPAQVAALTSNVIIMETRVVDGQSVLVPVVYLAQASQQNMNGPLIAATDIDLKNTQTFTNSGTVQASNTLSIDGKSIDNTFGALKSGGLMALTTTGDVNLTSANVNAGSLALNAGGNLILNTATNTLSQVGDTGATRITTTLGPLAQINVAGDAAIVTGGNFEQNAGALSVGGNLGMQIGGNWDLGAVQTGEHKVVERANGVSDTNLNSVTGSTVNVGGVSAIGVGGDLTARGAQIDLGGGGTIVAQGNVSLLTASATSTVDSNSSGSSFGRSYAETLHQSDEQLTGTVLTGGQSVAIVAGKDLNVIGSAISLDKGDVTLAAAGDVNVGAATETHVLDTQETHSHSTGVSGTKVASGSDQTAMLSQGSLISADGVTITSGRDINVIGSTVVGTNDVNLTAARDVTITTSQDTQSSQGYSEKSEYGFLSGMTVMNMLDGGLQGYSVGTRKTTDAQQATQVTNNGSMVGALNGNLTVTAGNDLHATGSVLYAGNDVNLAGKTVTIDAAQDTTTFNEQQSFSQTAVSGGISNPALSLARTAIQMNNDVKHVGGDARLTALAAATTGLAAKNAYDAVMSDPTALGGVGINVSLGTSHSNSNSSASSSTAVGSAVSAGHNVNITATGAGADSNINVIGSDITAGNNATLNAEGSINLQAAQNTDSQQSTNSGSSASIGVTFGVGKSNGISFQVGVSGTKGNGNGSDTTWTNTHVNAGNTLTLQSGGDTNLKGAVANGQQVVANVGGNLNIESLQDTSTYNSKQQSASVAVSVCVPPICYGGSSVSGSYSQQKLNSDYASVTEQSGINAGDGGFQINVKGNTDLKGAVITSSDTAIENGVNSLTTATLTHSDIQNRASYSGQSIGISGGYGGNIGKGQQGQANNVNPIPGTTLPKAGGLSMAPPIVMSASGDASGTTKSAISGGTITITDGAAQQQLTGQTADEAVAGISRDTSDTRGTVAPIFDKDKIEAGFDITSQFINEVGTFVNNRAKEADAAKAAANDPNLTPEQRAAAQQLADQLNAEWGPGGTYRQILTALTVAAGGNVTAGAGEFAQNATVAYIQELGASAVKTIADSLDSEEARAALHAIVGCAGAAASSQSCGAGALGAATSSVLGSLLAPTEGMSAEDRQARENLVTSLVAGIAAASGVNAATATGAGQIEGENNQFSMAPTPTLPPLGGYTGETAKKGDGVIADPATELDPSIKADTPLVTPLPGPGLIDQVITAATPDWLRALLTDPITNSSFWSSTKDKTPVENAYGHSTKHGDEFPNYQNSVQYVQAAQGFVNNPPEGTLTKTRPNGDTLYYDPSTNTFASKTKDGAPKTMFKPTAGMDYWNKQ
ncbi:filamentous hemagglutinin [Paraburkholderia sp. GAS448]|uniref:hemagglutinin repeat-containing protein n=1 Tax=Paraburkholderia sp. GAS448 TaxID=3035136 RepID=UPI003D1BED4A